MLKKFVVLIILSLIVSTSLIKNHTKTLDEEIFSLQESIIYLNSVKGLVQLENNYLSSPEQLSKLYELYFKDELKYTSREKIEIISDISQVNLENLNQNE
tara:strand:- start:3975 stop:4274 length:300 start_codon:yes stop_codon:yes gene_type:complete